MAVRETTKKQGPREGYRLKPGEVKRRRRLKRWGQETLADEAGCEVSTVRRAEANPPKLIQWAKVEQLAQALSCETNDLLESADGKPPGEFVIFPGAPVTEHQAYLGSWLGSGAVDRVYSVLDFVPREDLERPLAPVVRRGDALVLQIRFEHGRGGATAESWWSGVVYMGCDAEGLPATLDITPYRWFCIDARFYRDTPGARLEHSVPLNVRLEDSWTTAKGGSWHNSTSWSKRPLMLTEFFAIHRLDLNHDLCWTEDAWYWNTEPVDRRSILQFTVGHDRGDPPCSGTIEIRRAWLMPE